MRKHLLILFIFLITACAAFAQDIRVTGKVLDSKTKETLIGASVLLKGTTKAVSASLDGTFKISVPADGNAILVISYIGYITQQVPVNGKKDLGNIELVSNASTMNEVTISSDVAVDRKTPVAVSTINAEFIEEKLGSQEFPELLKETPGIQATRQGGGFGDSRISIRGFSSGSKKGNVAVTINGIPVNDMENGSIFWSNWAGLSDVSSYMQVQRGLGASKIVVPSFGGTVNIITRSTDAVQGGYISQAIGSDNYSKTSVSLSTGLNDKGWAASFAGGRTMGNGNADGLQFLGYDYFFNLSKVLSKTQSLSLTVMGAQQTHGQRFQQPIQTIRNAPQGTRFNANWGIKDGQIVNPSQNFFTKPIASLNHSWTIDNTSSLSTVLYASIGTGGGGSIGGSVAPRISDSYSPYDFTQVEKNNAASTDGSAATYFKASRNNHQWYGIRSTYNKTFFNNLSLSTGADLRWYTGDHYTEVTDLLGADYVLDKQSGTVASGNGSGNVNNPINRAKVGDKISFYNRDAVIYEGAFFQAEYSKNDLTAFVTLSGANTGNRRTDYFNYLDSDPAQTSPFVNFFTYQAKTGLNYNISSQQNIFANIGYMTKPPYFDNVFQKFTNTINAASVPEKLFSYELGYGYKSSLLSLNLNLYHTLYKDEAFANSYPDPTTNVLYSVNITGVNELHQGAELELKLRPIKDITIGGMLSVGDWHYTKDSGPAQVFNDQNVLIKSVSAVYLTNIKVGDAAQTTAAVLLDVNVLPQLKIGGTYNYYANYTSNFVFSNLTDATKVPYQPFKIPNYNLFDLNGVFRFKFAGLESSLIGNVNNVFNTKYIADALDSGATGLASAVNTYYGIGRTFTTTLKVKF